MKIVIVGAGISGLSLAIALARKDHDVILLESAPQLAEIGAGVQMTPQAVKSWFHWGLKDDLTAKSIVLQNKYIRNWKDSRIIGTVPAGKFGDDYGAPYIVIHRAILHDVLHKHAVKAGAEIRVNSKVVRYDFEGGAVELANGQRVAGDLVVASDGINSNARSQLLGSLDPGTKPTGWAAFRMMAEVSRLKADPITAELGILETHSSNLWIGPGKSVMAYLVKDTTMLNLALSHHDDIDTTCFTTEEYKMTVRDMFEDFDPAVQRLLDLCLPSITNWPVYATPPLSRWTHPSGRFALIGDAAHAMAFYLSMGVSVAVEDAVALSTALELAFADVKQSNGSNTKEPISAPNSYERKTRLQAALQTFENVRKQRAEQVQAASLHAGNALHVEEGRAREILHESLSYAQDNVYWSPVHRNTEKETPVNLANIHEELDPRTCVFGIADKGTRDWCYGYDVEDAVVKEWNLRRAGNGRAVSN